MNSYSRHTRNIDPSRARPDGTPDDDNRIEIGPTPLAFGEWAEAGLVAPNLEAMCCYRLDRLRAELVARDWGGVLLFNFANGERTVEAAERFADDLAEVLRASVGDNRRLGVDKIQIAGLRALERLGLRIEPGEALTERARYQGAGRDSGDALCDACL